jgi:tripartite-type tricarboxylate transporter receptor subunit TctC
MLAARLIAAVFAFAAIAAGPAAAQDWPTRPVTMIVPYAAGGPADVIGRVLASGMSDSLGQQVIVENLAGAGGMTGAEHIMHATPDGYQFMLGPGGLMSFNQSLYRHPPYDAATDFAPVGLIVTAPPILVVRKDFPANNLKDFIAYAKVNPGKLQFGSAGAGSGPHIVCVLLNTAAGISVVHVPYRGSGPAYGDLIPGRIDYMCDFISTALAQIKSNSVKPIATLTRERTPMLPDVPTADEQGLAGFDAPGWYGLFLPKTAPETIIRRLNKALVDALDSPPVRDRLMELGNTVPQRGQRTPEYLAKFVPSEIAKWAAPIKASGVSMD